VGDFAAGTDDDLTKPMASTELVIPVKVPLRRGPVAPSSVLGVGDLEVERLTQQVHRGGRRIELTPRKFAWLEYRAVNPGPVFANKAQRDWRGPS
jgi:DNA-binding response OmpR family regulator